MSSSLEILKARHCGHPDPQSNIKTLVYNRRSAAACEAADRDRSNIGCPDIEGVCAGNLMRVGPRILIAGAVAVGLLCSLPQIARATGAEPAKEPPVDPAPCVAAVSANADDNIIAACGALVDNEKTARTDPYQGADRARRRVGPQGSDRPRDQRLRRRAAARSGAGRYLQRPRRAVAQEGRPPQGAGRFWRGDQAEPRPWRREGQLPVAGAGAGAARRTDRGRWQAEL